MKRRRLFIFSILTCAVAVPVRGLEFTVSIEPGAAAHVVSPYLTGSNTGIANDTDSLIENLPINERLAELQTKLMRWPGGNELDTYHWEMPGIAVWLDGWETDQSSPYYAWPSQRNNGHYMDIDEYLAHCDAVGAEPIIGVNTESGRRYDRIEDSIQEAVRLMEYCSAKGYDVKYWYVDNEPFDIPGEEYGSYVNQIVPAMRAVDPDIKIIANPAGNTAIGSWGWINRVIPFIQEAGHSIDILDCHLYWAWGESNSASWQTFKAQNPLLYGHQGVFYQTYYDEFEDISLWLNDNGYGHIKLASLEWNVGKSTATDWSPYKISLCHAEMLMQFIRGNLNMANLWPRYNSPQPPSERGLFDPSAGFSTRPAFQVIKLLSETAGGKFVPSLSSKAEVPSLGVLQPETGKLLVYLLNKSDDEHTAVVSPGVAFRTVKAVAHFTENIDGKTSSLEPLVASIDGQYALVDIRANSFVMLTFELDPDPDTFEQWMSGFGLSAEEANLDADDDGLSNLFEYALGGNPLYSEDSGKWPNLSDVSPAGFEYSYIRRTDYLARSLSYSAEGSASLDSGSWDTEGITVLTLDEIDEDFERVTNLVTFSGSLRFVRLVVSLSE